jgi:hypothetical protein
MSAVAEGFVLRLAAPAERILFLHGIYLHFPPGPAVAFVIVAYLRCGKGDLAGNDIGAILADDDLSRVHLSF